MNKIITVPTCGRVARSGSSRLVPVSLPQLGGGDCLVGNGEVEESEMRKLDVFEV